MVTREENFVLWHQIGGLSNYESVINEMEDIVESMILLNTKSDNIILTEHQDIITAGTSSDKSEIVSNTKIPVIYTGRGGKFTFHGKGQRVIYPIIDLKNSPWNCDLKKYLNFLHSWIIETLKEFGIKSYRRDDHVGVWTKKDGKDAKIAAIGVRARKWIVFHGVAVNLYTELSNYKAIIPCGISDLSVTSAKDLGVEINLEEFDEILKKTYYTQKSILLENT